MAKRPTANATPARSTRPGPALRQRESDDSIRGRGLTPFLRPEHVIDGEWLKLTGFNSTRDRDTDTEQIICEVENEHGHTFSLGVRAGSPDHRVLHRALGREPKRWDGGVRVTIVKGKKEGQAFVNVSEADKNGPVWDGPAAGGDHEREPGEDE